MISAQGWLLDLTRTLSRLGRGPMTGIDRVELAYLHYLLTRDEPLFALVRTALGFVLLNKAGACGIFDRATGRLPLGEPDLLGLLTQRHLPQGLRAEADARRLAMARCLPVRLAQMLRNGLPAGVVYVNVGHANLTTRVMQAVKSVPDAKVLAMVHDTIPLNHPQLCRAGVLQAFAEKLRVVTANSDLVVHTARVTRTQTEAHFANMGRVPPGIVAPLGVTIAPADPEGLGKVRPPYFVVLGTIEPRKNIGLLVAVWRELQKSADPVPHLYVVGNRGWADPSLFDDLDALAARGDATLWTNLNDAKVTALLQGAEALLFPSLAEGYGLPPLEAAALGVPVLSGNLHVVVELLANYPVYLDTTVYAWVQAIRHRLTHRTQGIDAAGHSFAPPTWADHFRRVFGKD